LASVRDLLLQILGQAFARSLFMIEMRWRGEPRGAIDTVSYGTLPHLEIGMTALDILIIA
jgi:hypothetical protein